MDNNSTTAAQPLDLDSLCANLDKLSAAIMNLPCKMGRAIEMNGASAQVYKEGHRDARHAAIELVNEQVALIAQARTAQPAGAAAAVLPGEKWSKGNDSQGNEDLDEMACAGINIDTEDFPHQNAVEFYAQTLNAAQARRDAVLAAVCAPLAARLYTTASASGDWTEADQREQEYFDRWEHEDRAAQPVQTGVAVDERALFDAWLRRRWPNAQRPIDEKTATGSYAFTENNLLWEAWQARATLAPV